MTSACVIAMLAILLTLSVLGYVRCLASLRDARASREYWYQAHRRLLARTRSEAE